MWFYDDGPEEQSSGFADLIPDVASGVAIVVIVSAVAIAIYKLRFLWGV